MPVAIGKQGGGLYFQLQSCENYFKVLNNKLTIR
jgi:hypothetical protein